MGEIEWAMWANEQAVLSSFGREYLIIMLHIV